MVHEPIDLEEEPVASGPHQSPMLPPRPMKPVVPEQPLPQDLCTLNSAYNKKSGDFASL